MTKIKVETLTYNPFQENTIIVYHTVTHKAIIFDPGCSNVTENEHLLDFISHKKLTPSRLINTHCHIDHVLGNHLIHQHFELDLEAHQGEKPVLASCEQVSKMYGIPYTPSPDIVHTLEHGDIVELDDQQFEVRYTPGHSPASLCFIHHESAQVIGGDVLFYGSIGRTDLPGGDHKTLINSIHTQLMTLPDNYKVYCGHGPVTTIGHERATNPFLSE